MRLNGKTAILFLDILVISSIMKWQHDHPDEAATNSYLVSDIQETIDHYHLEGWRVARIANEEQLRNSMRKLRDLNLVAPPLFQKRNVLPGPAMPKFIAEFRRRFGSSPWNWPYGIEIIEAGTTVPKLDWEAAEFFPLSPIDMETTNEPQEPTNRRAESARPG